MSSSGPLRRVALVRTDVSEELSPFIIRVTRIGEVGITLAVTSNRRSLYFLSACQGSDRLCQLARGALVANGTAANYAEFVQNVYRAHKCRQQRGGGTGTAMRPAPCSASRPTPLKGSATVS
jgi:hypothetical protein